MKMIDLFKLILREQPKTEAVKDREPGTLVNVYYSGEKIPQVEDGPKGTDPRCR